MKWSAHVLAVLMMFGAIGTAHAEPTIEETFAWLSKKAEDPTWKKYISSDFNDKNIRWTFERAEYAAGSATIITTYASSGRDSGLYESRVHQLMLAESEPSKVFVDERGDGYEVLVETSQGYSTFDEYISREFQSKYGVRADEEQRSVDFVIVWYSPSESQAERIADAWLHAIRLANARADTQKSQREELF